MGPFLPHRTRWDLFAKSLTGRTFSEFQKVLPVGGASGSTRGYYYSSESKKKAGVSQIPAPAFFYVTTWLFFVTTGAPGLWLQLFCMSRPGYFVTTGAPDFYVTFSAT